MTVLRHPANPEVRAPLHHGRSTGGNGTDIGANVATLAFWIYQSEPSSGTVRIEAGRGSIRTSGVTCTWGFTGWRTAWIRYEDVKGHPRRNMNT